MPSGGGQAHTRGAAHGSDAAVEPGAAARPAHAGKANIIVCSGVFAKDSSHTKLTSAFQSRNVSNTQVDTNSGGKATATVLYAKDPKRRLEVWWSKPARKSDTHLIVINGQSDWIAPGELHLGLTLAELEKLNGKPFKISGFDKDHVATLSDWDGGTLSALAGGCKIGISLRADPKAPAATLGGLPADRAFTVVRRVAARCQSDGQRNSGRILKAFQNAIARLRRAASSRKVLICFQICEAVFQLRCTLAKPTSKPRY